MEDIKQIPYRVESSNRTSATDPPIRAVRHNLNTSLLSTPTDNTLGKSSPIEVKDGVAEALSYGEDALDSQRLALTDIKVGPSARNKVASAAGAETTSASQQTNSANELILGSQSLVGTAAMKVECCKCSCSEMCNNCVALAVRTAKEHVFDATNLIKYVENLEKTVGHLQD